MKKKNYKLKIKVLTGLHIGIGSDKPEIGGIDNQFIKHPIYNVPYIPGSSLKGKIRCLLETESDKYNGEDDVDIKRNFGDDDNSPTRFIFRDVNLIDEHLTEFESGEYRTEIKTEIKINRKTGTATRGALRTTERVPPGIEFEGEVLVRYDENTDELKGIKDMLDEGIKLLNNDYLGGSGSRGYGAVLVTLE
jgi:CRISPR-associated protein Csm3